jgi:hypothetical protein
MIELGIVGTGLRNGSRRSKRVLACAPEAQYDAQY